MSFSKCTVESLRMWLVTHLSLCNTHKGCWLRTHSQNSMGKQTPLKESRCTLAMWQSAITGNDCSQRRVSPLQDLQGKVEGFMILNLFFFVSFIAKKTYNECFHSHCWDRGKIHTDRFNGILLWTNPDKMLFSEFFTSLLLLDASSRGYVQMQLVYER